MKIGKKQIRYNRAALHGEAPLVSFHAGRQTYLSRTAALGSPEGQGPHVKPLLNT